MLLASGRVETAYFWFATRSGANNVWTVIWKENVFGLQRQVRSEAGAEEELNAVEGCRMLKKTASCKCGFGHR